MKPFQRNLFEIDNARNLNRNELVQTFVPTDLFWRLLSSKNHIVLGSRGSGKTCLLKMLSHDHLSLSHDTGINKIVKNKQFIGVFIPTSIEWIGALKNKPWQTESEKEDFFVWKLNVASCLSFITTLKSCLDTYVKPEVDRIKYERQIVSEISSSWNFDEPIFELFQLEKHLGWLENKKRVEVAISKIMKRDQDKLIGLYFYTDVFAPLKTAIRIVNEILNFPTHTTWLICIDEAEYLDESHFAILNTCMRSDTKEIIFKISTMPYKHKTLKTNLGNDISLNEGHDFEYLYIDNDPVGTADNLLEYTSTYHFAQTLYNKRSKTSRLTEKSNLKRLLGESDILMSNGDKEKLRKVSLDLIKKHCSAETFINAQKAFDEDKSNKYDPQFHNKLINVLRLRDQVLTAKGRGEISCYSGVEMVIRCSDGNPRRLIRIFNRILNILSNKRIAASQKYKKLLSSKEQNRIITEFSNNELDVIYSEPELGPNIVDFINKIGKGFQRRFIECKLTSSVYSSIDIPSNISGSFWTLITACVALGLLYPTINPKRPTRLPVKNGSFRLAYALSPKFTLFPRRGDRISLYSLLADKAASDDQYNMLNM
jgi:Cdc6-like AAA superfamily ATPase